MSGSPEVLGLIVLMRFLARGCARMASITTFDEARMSSTWKGNDFS